MAVLIRRLKKNLSLRVVSLTGMSIVFACMILSYAYIKYEWSYDRFHEKGDRIVRLSIRYGNEPVDGRIYGENNLAMAGGVPGVEDAVLLNKVETAVLNTGGKARMINNFYFATANFFDIFGYSLAEGDAKSVLDAPEKAAVSKRLARELFGEDAPVGKEIQLSSRRFETRTVFVSGVFEDFPENTHFHTDLIVHRPDNDRDSYSYAYLLLHPHADRGQVRQAIAARLDEMSRDSPRKASPILMPLTDIHLHSHLQREMEVNGNISYIYIIVGVNILLLTVVLFNLRLNAGLMFAHSRQYYRLLRLNGASPSTILTGESLSALVIGTASVLTGCVLTYLLHPLLHVRLETLSGAEAGIFCLSFVAVACAVSLLPALRGMSTTLFLNSGNDLRPSHFSLSSVRVMLIAQFCMVMFIVILGFGISRQMHLISVSQMGGGGQFILAIKEQPDAVKARYDMLRAELLKYPEIEAVTSSMQLPGTAIRDAIYVRREGEAADEGRYIPLLAVGDDFLPFFGISPVAGNVFQPSTRTYGEEEQLLLDIIDGRDAQSSALTEEYVINLSAMQQLGFASPDEAVGKMLHFEQPIVGYIKKGRIAGVTRDFTYTNAYEASMPLIIMQRKMFQHCIMARLSPDRLPQALETFRRVWAEVIPDYPVDYAFLSDVYAEIYHSDLKAGALVRLFSLLSLLVANMGLIIIMAFVIRRKTKEIGIRKVHGATWMDIVRLLNTRISLWIATAFVIALPLAWWVTAHWLENFAQKTRLDWQVFILAGLSVWLVSVLAVAWQSWQAARLDPVRALKVN
ncbi:MAG: ABC transporter permease [Tannerella sp.]|jgi:putative ABC transport system permease protein|nr:ABC transporter permease [Tannerella sp.]